VEFTGIGIRPREISDLRFGAVDVEDLPGDEACVLKIENSLRDVFRLTHPLERVEQRHSLVGFGSVNMPGAKAFTRMPREAYSIASPRVAAVRPPFVSDASTASTFEFAYSTRVVAI
jgi:hypothetical protein